MTTNTLTNLIPDLYAALDVVSRELVGMIPAVTVDASVNRAAVNENVRVPIAPANTAGGDITPAMSIPAEADQTIGYSTIAITKARAFPFSWNGEEQRGLNNGPGYLGIRANQIAQAMRAAVNEVETDLCALHAVMSRAAGTAGTTPFATTTAGLTSARKILADNGAPLSDAQLVLDTTAGANLRTLLNINSTRDESKLPISSQGVITRISDMNIRESGQVVTSTAGTGATVKTNTAGYAIGATTITLKSTGGTGTVVAGDVITFAGDTNQYVVTSGDSDISDGGTITIAAPGLRKAIAASETVITIVAAAARSMAFARSAIVLATRLPERPAEGDLALDVMTITDPRSGLSFEVAIYGGYRKIRYEIALAWGVKCIKPEHTALLLG
jgi:hypothetical protein